MYIFEPTYVRMVKDSIEQDIPIAIGLGDPILDENGSEIANVLIPRSIQGLGKAHIIEEYEDGSLYILIQGIGKVELDSVVQELPYMIARAELIHDLPSSGGGLLDAPINALRLTLFDWLEENVKDESQREAFYRRIQSTDNILDYLAMFFVADRELKQIFLETASLYDRIVIMSLLTKIPSPRGETTYYGNIIKRYESLEFLDVASQ